MNLPNDLEKRVEDLEKTVEDLGTQMDTLYEIMNGWDSMLSILSSHLEGALHEIMVLRIRNKRDEGITDAY